MHTILMQELVEKFDAELVKLGYSKNSLRNYRIFWKQISTYCSQHKQWYFCEKVALDFLEDRYHLSEVLKTRPLTRNETHVRQMIRKLVYFQMYGAVGRMNGVAERHVVTKELIDVLSAYTEYCVRYGYAPSTRRRLREIAVRFFVYLEARSVLRCSNISERIIVGYVNSLKSYSYRSLGLILSGLRTFLSFLHTQGFHCHNLSGVLPYQQAREASSIPTVWSQDAVLKLLKSIDRGNPCGKRDYAIFLLVAMLGMRAGDVRSLKLKNLNWKSNTIEFVQSKTTVALTLPLLKDVGWAIIDYLQNGRPKVDSPFVFLRHLPPFGKVHDNNCFYHIVKRCIRVSRVVPPKSRNLGMHSLRHTLASTLLSQKTPLSTIAGVLGHANIESTSVYLRTDINALRDCTLKEPEVVQ